MAKLPIVPLLVGATVLAAVGGTSKRRGRGGKLPPSMPTPLAAGQEDIRYLGEWAFLDEEWLIFLETVAWNESKFDNLVGRGRSNGAPDWAQINEDSREVNAAQLGYDRNSYLKDCPWPAARYTFGSGGWFGLVVASGVVAFRGTRYECIDPWAVFDPAPSLVMAVEYARRIMRYDAFNKQPTWLNLRQGWGNPADMGDASALASMEERFGNKLVELGYPANFMYRNVTQLPVDNPADLLDALTEVF